MTKYINGPGVDNKLKMTSNGTVRYFVTDHLGSTNALTDETGAIVEQTKYDSYGNATANLSTRYQFTGREFDNLTGLHYYRARWYDASVGRFISEDPIGFAGGDVNLYGYVGNTPNKYSDPMGLEPYELPSNPGTDGANLPPGWRHIPEHRDPNNPELERWVSPDGNEGLEYHPGKSGEPGWEGKDHWHKLKPKPGRNDRWEKDDTYGKDGHLSPGEVIDLKWCSSPRPNNSWRFPDWAYPPPYTPAIPSPYGMANPYQVVTGTILVGGVLVVILVLAS